MTVCVKLQHVFIFVIAQITVCQIPRDLKLDHLVKVISPEGRVLQGRVRYIGSVPGREDAHVGVELPYRNGSSDGTFHGKKFFEW